MESNLITSVFDKPFFSVIMPTFNRSELLMRAVSSLMSQTELDFEIIIVDDQSSDETPSVMRDVVKMNPTFHISYVYHSHTGLGIGRNIGINNSRGRYITFLDDDDEYLHDHLEIRKKILKHNPEIDLLHGGVKIIGDEYVPDRYNLRQRIHLSECVIGGTFFIKKSIFDIVGGFGSDNFGDDTDFFEKVKNAGFKINKINNPTYVYYRNGPSITTNFKIES